MGLLVFAHGRSQKIGGTAHARTGFPLSQHGSFRLRVLALVCGYISISARDVRLSRVFIRHLHYIWLIRANGNVPSTLQHKIPFTHRGECPQVSVHMLSSYLIECTNSVKRTHRAWASIARSVCEQAHRLASNHLRADRGNLPPLRLELPSPRTRSFPRRAWAK